MKEIRDIVYAYDDACSRGLGCALATVVRVKGSAYRRPGARMLVCEDGKLTGVVSGGCLDGHVTRKALLVINQRTPVLATYDSTDEEDTPGLALGCNGLVQIFIEPLVEGDPDNPMLLLKRLLSNQQKATLTTIFYSDPDLPVQTGTALLYSENGFTKCTVPESLENSLVADARNVFYNKSASVISYVFGAGLSIKVFVDYMKPPVHMVIVGAGNDAIPLSAFSGLLGWQVTVVDGRSNYANGARFPMANKVICVKPHKILSEIKPDEGTVFVLMTHNYDYDLAALKKLIFEDLPYIGVLGPGKKKDQMIEALEASFGPLPEYRKSKIYGPTGLDIGAETPEEIALSIIAEVKKVMMQGTGLSLREKKNNIHSDTAKKPIPFF